MARIAFFKRPLIYFGYLELTRQATLYTNATTTDDDDNDDDCDDDVGDYITVSIITAVLKHYLRSTGHQGLTAFLLLMRKTAYPNHERVTEKRLNITQLLPCTSFPVLLLIIITELRAPQPELCISKTSFQFYTPGYLAHPGHAAMSFASGCLPQYKDIHTYVSLACENDLRGF